MAYEIEKGVPLTGSAQHGRKSPLRVAFEAMSPGDSIFVPDADISPSALASRMDATSKAIGSKFARRKVDGGQRIWRIA